MADLTEVLGLLFSTLLVIILAMMVLNTYFLTRQSVALHLREIYFVNNAAFKRSWYLIMSGMTLFVFARGLTEASAWGALEVVPGLTELFLVLFAVLVFAAFVEVLFVFQRYIPRLGSEEGLIDSRIRRHFRDAVIAQDDERELVLPVTQAADIFRGRPTLGPQVHLTHYRGVVLGMTRYLEQRFGPLGDALLHSVGRHTALHAARDLLREAGGDPDAALDQFLLELRSALVGIPAIIVRNGDKVTIRISECAACSGIEPSGRYECHYLTGLFTGLFEVLRGGAEARETRCSARGDDACEIEVRFQPGGKA